MQNSTLLVKILTELQIYKSKGSKGHNLNSFLEWAHCKNRTRFIQRVIMEDWHLDPLQMKWCSCGINGFFCTSWSPAFMSEKPIGSLAWSSLSRSLIPFQTEYDELRILSIMKLLADLFSLLWHRPRIKCSWGPYSGFEITRGFYQFYFIYIGYLCS